MTLDQGLVFAILAGLLALLAWGRIRYDLLAFGALLAAVLTGLVTPAAAFSGFGHPATVTVALILIVSRALTTSGATDPIARLVQPFTRRNSSHVGILAGLAAAMSGFMNNVGTLGLMMPVALTTAAKAGRRAGTVLMPLSFGAILGGLVTLIGTPPNIIVATWRGQALGEPFRMFDFTPVGAVVALAGVAFVAAVGWRLVPRRGGGGDTSRLFNIEDYLAELCVPDDAEIVGRTLAEIAEQTTEIDAQIVGLYRRGRRLPTAAGRQPVEGGDVLLVEAGPEALDRFAAAVGGAFGRPREEEEGKRDQDEDQDGKARGEGGSERPAAGDRRGRRKTSSERLKLTGDEVQTVEAVIAPGSRLDGRTVESLRLARRWGVTLLGLSRQGRQHRGRLREFRLRTGDVLLLLGDRERLAQAMQAFDCLPLAERGVSVGRRGRPWLPAAIFGGAIALSAVGLFPIYVGLGLAALAMVVVGAIPVREIYDAVDWPVIVLLGALIPVGGAMETTGGTQLITDAIVAATGSLPGWVMVALLLVVTMTLSDVLNNAATAVVMAPIAAGLAGKLGASPDPFLMAVAVGASCAFLTPIGHQNNALIMGPGGYSFGDYWRLGLPLEILVVTVATPAILLFWPL